MLYQFIPIGDYCNGMLDGLLFLALGILFSVLFLIITIYSIIKLIKYKQQFSFVPLIILIIVIACSYSLLKTDNKKFWTTKVLVGDIDNGTSWRANRITLYKNNSFGITSYHTDYKCTIQGKYTQKGDTIQLYKKDLKIHTDAVFTTHYIMSKNDSTLVALDKNFEDIKISNISKGL